MGKEYKIVISDVFNERLEILAEAYNIKPEDMIQVLLGKELIQVQR